MEGASTTTPSSENPSSQLFEWLTLCSLLVERERDTASTLLLALSVSWAAECRYSLACSLAVSNLALSCVRFSPSLLLCSPSFCLIWLAFSSTFCRCSSTLAFSCVFFSPTVSLAFSLRVSAFSLNVSKFHWSLCTTAAESLLSLSLDLSAWFSIASSMSKNCAACSCWLHPTTSTSRPPLAFIFSAIWTGIFFSICVATSRLSAC
mmetsp:Transcript_6283/g.9777  ORF Transcript_6283/g.9777 Transcript_6283/m.9777 type:complete len:206 (-) Transcript_6283:461-1078(-)